MTWIFVVAEALEHDVKLGLLLYLSSASAGAATTAARSSGGNAEGVLDSLDELGSLEKGHFLKSIDDLIGGSLAISKSFRFPCGCTEIS